MGAIKASQMARLVSVRDRRTLHRHLAAQGQSFSRLLQELRRDGVHKHSRKGQSPLADCANLPSIKNLHHCLGHSRQSAFAY